MAGGDDDTVSQPFPSRAQVLGCTVCAEDRHGNRGGRSERSACVNADINVIGGQDFQGGPPCGFTQRVGVATNEKRTIEALVGSVVDNRLGDRNDVCFIELAIECATAVSGGTKRHPLIGACGIRFNVVIRRNQRINIGEVFGKGNSASSIKHAFSLQCFPQACKRVHIEHNHE